MQRRAVCLGVVLAVAGGSTLLGNFADQWIDLPSLSTPRQEAGVAGSNGKIYVIGGILSNRAATGIVERYDVERKVWESVAPLPNNMRVHHVGAAAVAGKVYAIGGLDSSFRAVRTVFAFDTATDGWRRVADLPRARGGMGIATLDGRIYAAGGQDGSTSFADLTVYSPEDDRWEVLPRMPTARNHLAGAAFEGRFYAVGGRAGRLFGALEVYDPLTRQWDRLAPMPTPRAGIAAAVIDDGLYVFGGEGNPASPRGIFSETESYHFGGDKWYERLDMQHPRHGIGAAVLEDSADPRLIYIPGGAAIQGFDVVAVHDAFQVGTPPWAPSPSNFVRADANGNGLVDISDAVFTLARLFSEGEDLPCADAADANDDGAVNVADAVFTLNYLFAAGPTPPPPGPSQSGGDPTEDALGCRF